MKTPLRVSRVSFIRAASGFALAALFAVGNPLALAAGGKPGGSTEPLPGAIAIGTETTPGDSNSLYRIAQPGSYYLTGNVSGVSGKAGIEIASSHVMLDLNGFTLFGNALASEGIRIEAGARIENITIRNGSVTGWGSYGINLSGLSPGNTAETVVLEKLQASRNLQSGIRGSVSMTVRDCTAAYNGDTGIQVNGGSVIENSTSVGNGRYGFWVGSGVARGCSASFNAEDGFWIFFGTVVDCSASFNGKEGFYSPNGGVLRNCSSVSNTGYGYKVGSGGTISGCAARANTAGGIRAEHGGSLIMDNVIACEGAMSRGIHATGASMLIANNAVLGSNIGILVDGSGGSNRIEANNLTQNSIGLKVDSTVNIIVRNTARNTSKNYQIVANNRVGTIVVPALSAAIDGNSGGGSGTTDPWSNLAY